jgi:hypothetical protein
VSPAGARAPRARPRRPRWRGGARATAGPSFRRSSGASGSTRWSTRPRGSPRRWRRGGTRPSWRPWGTGPGRTSRAGCCRRWRCPLWIPRRPPHLRRRPMVATAGRPADRRCASGRPSHRPRRPVTARSPPSRCRRPACGPPRGPVPAWSFRCSRHPHRQIPVRRDGPVRPPRRRPARPRPPPRIRTDRRHSGRCSAVPTGPGLRGSQARSSAPAVPTGPGLRGSQARFPTPAGPRRRFRLPASGPGSGWGSPSASTPPRRPARRPRPGSGPAHPRTAWGRPRRCHPRGGSRGPGGPVRHLPRRAPPRNHRAGSGQVLVVDRVRAGHFRPAVGRFSSAARPRRRNRSRPVRRRRSGRPASTRRCAQPGPTPAAARPAGARRQCPDPVGRHAGRIRRPRRPSRGWRCRRVPRWLARPPRAPGHGTRRPAGGPRPATRRVRPPAGVPRRAATCRWCRPPRRRRPRPRATTVATPSWCRARGRPGTPPPAPCGRSWATGPSRRPRHAQRRMPVRPAPDRTPRRRAAVWW